MNSHAASTDNDCPLILAVLNSLSNAIANGMKAFRLVLISHAEIIDRVSGSQQVCFHNFFDCKSSKVGSNRNLLFQFGSSHEFDKSILSVFCGFTILKLFEAGKIALNDPISEYLPEFASPVVSVQSANNAELLVPARNPITVRHLLSMTAGLSYGGTQDAPDIATAELMEELNHGSYTVREFSRRLAALPLAFEPGTRFRYSYCADVLGALVEVVSGMTFGQFLKTQLFEPLGMTHTAFFFEDLPDADIVTFYSRIAGELAADPMDEDAYSRKRGFESGGAGMLSSLSDMTRFAAALSTHTPECRVLGQKTIALMSQDHLLGQAKEDFRRATETNAWRLLRGYSYGLGVRTLVDLPQSGINGNCGEFGWGSVGGSFIVCDPQEELAICYLHNLHRPDNLENLTTPRIKAMVYSQLE